MTAIRDDISWQGFATKTDNGNGNNCVKKRIITTGLYVDKLVTRCDSEVLVSMNCDFNMVVAEPRSDNKNPNPNSVALITVKKGQQLLMKATLW